MLRLRRHGLAEPVAGERLAEQVGAVCGIHAQVMSAAELAIGLRVRDVTRADVRRALWEERTLVKTHGPRGTLHLLPARELGLWNRALAAVPAAGGGQAEGVRLSAEQLDAVLDAIGAALEGERLTLAQLDAAVAKRAGRWAAEKVLPAFGDSVARWRQAIPTAANRGMLCFGPNEGRATTYVHPRSWLGGVARVREERALDELLRRYLRAYGPATPAQFARWLGTRPEWARERFDALAGELTEIDLGGSAASLLRADAELPGERPRGVRLLPYFDPFVVGCHPRERLFPPAAAARALRNGQAGNFPVLLIDGIVAGVWSQRRRGRRLDLTVEPLRRLPAVRRGPLDDEVARVAAIMEANAELTIGRVTVGGHS
jgi:hypothetical protein